MTRTSYPSPYIRLPTEYIYREIQKKRLYQTAFFKLLKLEDDLWWSVVGYTLEIFRPNGFLSRQNLYSRQFEQNHRKFAELFLK